MWTAFEYMYRDAGNFKAFGTVTLKGAVSRADEKLVRERLDSGEFFIAEQVGVPPLYGRLYQWSDGPTQSDHCWHEFTEFRRRASPPKTTSKVLAAKDFIGRFAAVERWKLELSRHYELWA